MGFILDEKSFLNNQAFKFEDRLNSQYTKFLDKPPTYVTYYHINTISSTTDNGFGNVQELIGDESPLRFSEIKDFPIYGIEHLMLDLSEEEEGLQTSLEGEGIILPNTVKPLPGDYFTITYLREKFLFVVTEIRFDTIKSNNYYKITYSIKSVNSSSVEEIEKQVDEKFTCVKSNVGTEDKCIIEDSQKEIADKIGKVVKDLSTNYLSLFYNSKYNAIMYTTIGGTKIYNKYLGEFVNRTKLFSDVDSFNTLYFTNEEKDPNFVYDFENSFYACLIDNSWTNIDSCKYSLRPVINLDSVFHLHREKKVRSLDCNGSEHRFVDSRLYEMIKNNKQLPLASIIDKGMIIDCQYEQSPVSPILINGDVEMMDRNTRINMLIMASLLIDYFNDNIGNLNALEIDNIAEMRINPKFWTYLYVPVIIFILKHYQRRYMNN